jgi:hypothetical protein
MKSVAQATDTSSSTERGPVGRTAAPAPTTAAALASVPGVADRRCSTPSRTRSAIRTGHAYTQTGFFFIISNKGSTMRARCQASPGRSRSRCLRGRACGRLQGFAVAWPVSASGRHPRISSGRNPASAGRVSPCTSPRARASGRGWGCETRSGARTARNATISRARDALLTALGTRAGPRHSAPAHRWRAGRPLSLPVAGLGRRPPWSRLWGAAPLGRTMCASRDGHVALISLLQPQPRLGGERRTLRAALADATGPNNASFKPPGHSAMISITARVFPCKTAIVWRWNKPRHGRQSWPRQNRTNLYRITSRASRSRRAPPALSAATERGRWHRPAALSSLEAFPPDRVPGRALGRWPGPLARPARSDSAGSNRRIRGGEMGVALDGAVARSLRQARAAPEDEQLCEQGLPVGPEDPALGRLPIWGWGGPRSGLEDIMVRTGTAQLS